MRSSTFPQVGLFAAAAVILVLAVAVWTGRQSAESFGPPNNSSLAGPQRKQQHIQKAASLLFRAFHADNYLTYSALSSTMAMYGGGKMKSEAEIIRAPQKFAIAYKSGDMKGVNAGYNQYWFWRQEQEASPLQPYAQIRHDTTEMATQRFALMLENYAARYTGTEKIEGREADIVELKPFRPVDGAVGPAKRLAVDRETGLTLRVQTFNYQMQLVMESTLKNVNYAPHVTPTTFRSPQQIKTDKQDRDWVAQEEGKDEAAVTRLTGLQPPKPSYLPDGFVFDGVGMHKCEYAGAPYSAALARYTDGLNTLTVFHLKQESAAKAADNGATKIGNEQTPEYSGATNNSSQSEKAGKLASCAFGPGTLVTRDVKDGRLLAVSDLPAPVLRQVLNSVPVAGDTK